MIKIIKWILIIIILIASASSRNHHLILKDDMRPYFKINEFGYFIGGKLYIKLESFSFEPFSKSSQFGFTLAKTISDSLSPNLEGRQERCLHFNDVTQSDDNIGLVVMKFDLEREVINFSCSKSMSSLNFFHKLRHKRAVIPIVNNTRVIDQSGANLVNKSETMNIQTKQNDHQTHKLDAVPSEISKIPSAKKDLGEDKDKPIKKIQSTHSTTLIPVSHSEEASSPDFIKTQEDQDFDDSQKSLIPDDNDDKDISLTTQKGSCTVKEPIKLVKTVQGNQNSYSFEVDMIVVDGQEGLYSLFFHNCDDNLAGGFRSATKVNLSLYIMEKNYDNYLSAGEIPLPQLYFALSVIFFILGIVWTHVIRNHHGDTFKIHYLMAALVFVKSLSLLFHGINYHFIAVEGSEIETWAILYYITHLLKGALLFITIVLIGTGWAFIKHILSDKDKNIFMIVIPLQVLANVAEIITEESEEGTMKHNMWREVFILVDLLCCGAILFPVIWSIRHLQEASHIDGKAAINLKKLKLFRRFYVMIVCYIYFTRIIVYLLKITVPFQYEWLNVFCEHSATLLFFILTGYHFQPTQSNPYFQLTQEEEDLEMEEVLFSVTPNIYTENLTKKRNRENDANEDSQNLISKRESSHDFD